MKRIGMLTSGGDCQGLNSTLRGVAKALYEEYGKEVEIYGFRDGYRGLIEGDVRLMSPRDFSGILTIGGTILGTSRQPFKNMRDKDENGVDKVTKMIATYQKMELDCLVILGGNGTTKTANLLREEGLNVISLPKTIDNDLWGTEVTFGYQTAMDIATDVIDKIHSTATSHSRVFLVEIMGHGAGWLTLTAGIAGGADIILIPEIPYNLESVVAKLEERRKNGHSFTIVAVAEGAISQEEAQMSKKEFKAARAQMTDPSISFRLARELGEACGQEIRVVNPGHFQRGGGPDAYDRILTTRLGTGAARLIKHKQYGNMVAIRNDQIVAVPLSEVAGKLKTVPVDNDLVQAARDIGISFGDEKIKKDKKDKKDKDKKDKKDKDKKED
ncbi:6-phosphofructokinase [Butyricicoccus porcorum]|uniref:ATP-dependent 6-phosphofructokinase n=1 Tax=Butyricicoccus porcorum TaxID=1945634 RepID=A0A252F2D1_9FIRM|nr:ATP-dependent 6-phosphofructokinase [Butyricicoccus porcorum]MCI6927044.1 6-phosphofructokinase [Butyricicoccus porcorum]OUM19889.1 6-phosphofructokinase [Butyricicoccus porcorum]